ncbi:MAG: hypothetical protein U0350_13150 [Caldilineaceae bacterium]
MRLRAGARRRPVSQIGEQTVGHRLRRDDCWWHDHMIGQPDDVTPEAMTYGLFAYFVNGQ